MEYRPAWRSDQSVRDLRRISLVAAVLARAGCARAVSRDVAMRRVVRGSVIGGGSRRLPEPHAQKGEDGSRPTQTYEALADRVQLLRRFAQVAFADDVVAVEHLPRPPAHHLHGDLLRDASADQVAACRAAEVMWNSTGQ